MFATNAGLNALDALFTLLDKVSEFDYIKFGRNVIDKAIILTAVIVAVTSYVITACQLFWLEHGDTIIINSVRLVVNSIDFTREVYLIGGKLRVFVSKTLNHAADSTFFAIASL